MLRALFKNSDPKRFNNIFTTLFTLFTMLTLDDWSLIYIDNRAQGGQRPGSRAQVADTNGSVTSAIWGLLMPARKGGRCLLIARFPPPGAWYIIPILMIYIIIQYFIFLK